MELENPTPVVPGSSRPSSAAHEQAWELLALEKDEEDALLKELAGGIEDLTQATALQAVINTSTSVVSHLASKLPSLVELNLNGSVIQSVRDLGTGFQCLRVLWISRCGLSGLQGIGAMPALHELYASFNDIADLQPLDACTSLEVLDLEGNCVADLDSAIYLSACSSLQCLTLAGNPVAQGHDYRYQIVSAVPGLEVLDDVPVSDQDCSTPPPAAQPAAGISSTATHSLCEQAAGGESSAPAESQSSTIQTYSSSVECSTANEFDLVCSAIKHARVGVDSHEFQEAEMLTLLGGLPGSLGTGTLCISADGAAVGFSSLGSSRPPPTSGSEASSYPDASGMSELPRPSTSSALMPPTAGSWIRAVRSSQAGALASVRASRTSPLHSGMLQSTGAQATSSSSAGPSPAGSRPSTAATGEQEQVTVSGGHSIGGWMGGPQAHSFSVGSMTYTGAGSNPYLARPVSAAVGGRPASARPGTMSSVTAPGTRPGTGASAPAAPGGGLYWKKHRLTPAGGPGSSLSESLLDGVSTAALPTKEAALLNMDGNVVTPSSALTYGGGDAIGGNLAKDLRRRRKGSKGKDGAPAGPSASEAARQLLRSRGSSGPLGSGLAMSYNSEALLQELIRWKLETADRALAVEEDQGQGSSAAPWNDSEAAQQHAAHDLLSVGSSRGAGDLLQLPRSGSSSSPQEEAPVMYLAPSPSGRRTGAAVAWEQQESMQGPAAALSPVASPLRAKGSKPVASVVDGSCQPPDLQQPGLWEEAEFRGDDAACTVHRTARRTMLAKVVRDVAASKDLSAAVQSWAAEIICEEPVFVKDSTRSSAGAKTGPAVTRSLSKQSSANGRPSPATSTVSAHSKLFQRTPSARSTEGVHRQQQPIMHRSTSLSASATASRHGSSVGKEPHHSSKGTLHQQQQGGPGRVPSSRQPASHHATYEERLSTKSRPQAEAAAQQGTSHPGAPEQSGTTRPCPQTYSVSCATGEVALARVNPRPMVREDDPLGDSLDDD